ncbi:MAG: hypothetical protein S4CHLAM20_03010 [Chlamydiia bacterium]|nr:hypothetical protein [Chlamydiia bacterium]
MKIAYSNLHLLEAQTPALFTIDCFSERFKELFAFVDKIVNNKYKNLKNSHLTINIRTSELRHCATNQKTSFLKTIDKISSILKPPFSFTVVFKDHLGYSLTVKPMQSPDSPYIINWNSTYTL